MSNKLKRLTSWDKGSAYVRECFEREKDKGGCEDMDSEKGNRCSANIDVCHRLAKYEDTKLSPEEVIKLKDFEKSQCSELLAENTQLAISINQLQKAYILACRCLADNLDCPAADGDASFPECNGESEECGNSELWKRWQKYFIEKVENEALAS